MSTRATTSRLFLLACLGWATCAVCFAGTTDAPNSLSRPTDSAEKRASNVRTKQAEDWEKWHQSLDEVIKRKFAETCAQDNLRADPPLVCEVKYDISRIGQILNIELSKKTNSRICNIAAETVIRSLEKDPILNFPDGATESTIRKCSTFSYSPKRENLY